MDLHERSFGDVVGSFVYRKLALWIRMGAWIERKSGSLERGACCGSKNRIFGDCVGSELDNLASGKPPRPQTQQLLDSSE